MKLFGPQLPAAELASQKTALILLRGFTLVCCAATFLWGYAALEFNGLRHAEAMDQAQLARSLARGEGFTTQLIRPLSLGRLADLSPSHDAVVLDNHPDLLNPPAYPLLLGALFYVMEKGDLKIADTPKSGKEKPAANTTPAVEKTSRVGKYGLWLFHWPIVWAILSAVWFLVIVQEMWVYRVPAAAVPWHVAGILGCLAMWALSWMPGTSFKVGPDVGFTVFGPDRYLVYVVGVPLALLNGLLVYWIGRRLFDRRAGTIAALLFIVSEMTCQYAISGLSTMLAMTWLCLATLALVVAAEWRETNLRPRAAVALALAAAVLLGGAFLTKYTAGWLLLPACILCWRWWGLLRGALVALGMALVFLVVTAPWLVRNYTVSHSMLGIASYATIERTPALPGDMLQRSLEIKGTRVAVSVILNKVYSNAYQLCADCSWACGAWLTVAAFVGAICYRFRRPQANQLKWFIMWGALLLFAAMCVVGVESPPDGSIAQAGNALVLMLPLMTVFSAAIICVWTDALRNAGTLRRHAAIAFIAVGAVFPTAMRMAGPPAGRLPYPPYHPPVLAQIAGGIEPTEIMVSDQPWAVAWYGDRRCIWLPYSVEQLYKVNDMGRHIAALLLTPVTLNSRLLTEVLSREWQPWAPILEFLVFPKGFPLQTARIFVGRDLKPVPWQMFGSINIKDLAGGINMILLSDRKRWADNPSP